MSWAAFLIGALVGHRLWRGALALLFDEMERAQANPDAPEEPPPTWVDYVPVLGPVLAMTLHARLAQLWLPAKPPPAPWPLVGVVCGLGLALFAGKLGPSWALVGVGPLVVILLVASACDMLTGIVLDEISGHAFLWTLAYVLMTQVAAMSGALPPAVDPPYPYDGAAVTLSNALWGIGTIGLALWLLNLRSLITGTNQAMGGGVVKLLLSLSLLVGWRGALCALLLGLAIAVIPAGLVLAALPPPAEDAPDAEPAVILFPFMSFAALGALITLWFGHPAIATGYQWITGYIVNRLTGL